MAGTATAMLAPHMTAHQLTDFKDRLLALRAELGTAASAAPVPRECGNDTDHAVAAHAEEAFWNKRARLRARMDEVDAALQRIADGSYGYCVESGEPIAMVRLEANPTARYTLAVQQRLESVGR